MYDLSNQEENSQVWLKVCELQYPSYKLKNMIVKENWDTFKSLDITENNYSFVATGCISLWSTCYFAANKQPFVNPYTSIVR